MITATRTVALNAAFLDEVKQDDVELKRLLDELRQMCSPAIPQQIEPESLCELLGRTRDQLKFHLDLEEAVGYFEGARSVPFRISAEAERLRCEHQDLLDEMARIADAAEAALSARVGGGAAEIVRQFRSFDERLRDHELRECHLIWESGLLDLGVVD